ncbi:YaiI/YqxD family protein [Salirhabdus salicampi]|uniref:YaiI/YqxD family protein n=1 Tax=Salirhabdus salicampi TaxID=476102 RepID=UPI0020C2E011|nr:YaiI/YqxD family protein [Salirhabdus salicampi]MCP8615425.1 YaiI/YqxD family protein [Salirhabdus salicampi]
MEIYVDADACPVKSEIIHEAKQFQVPVLLVKSYSHFSHSPDPEGVSTKYVDTGADSVDYHILQLAQKGDIIVTQDYGLAALGLGKGCTVLHHKGFIFSQKNIDQLLNTRHAHAKARRSGAKTKGPKALTNEDKENFSHLLRNILTEKSCE